MPPAFHSFNARTLRHWAGTLLCCTAGAVWGQWNVPTTIVLDGVDAADRQVTGLAAPVQDDAAVSLDALRHLHTSFAPATGSDPLIADLVPAPTTLVPGMVITLVPASTNAAAAQLVLNGAPATPIVKRGALPLEAGDLVAGAPVRMAFDGTRFVVLDAMPLPCPSGFTALSRGTCIADSTAGEANYFDANLVCRALNARLCTFGEWVSACNRIPDFFSTVPVAEWVDHAANNTNSAKLVGHGENGSVAGLGAGCIFGGWNFADTGISAIRCCTDR